MMAKKPYEKPSITDLSPTQYLEKSRLFTQQPLLLGLLGEAGSGKDSLAKWLVETGVFHCKVGLVDPLRDFVSSVYGIPLATLQDPLLKEQPDPRYEASPRFIMQTITDACRAVHPTIWVDKLVRDFNRATTKIHNLRQVVSDVRLANECEAIKVAGGIVWRIVCPDSPHRKTMGTKEASHVTERNSDIIFVDATLSAPFGHLDALYAHAMRLLKDLRGVTGTPPVNTGTPPVNNPSP
jgi:hypothetical protein